MKKIFVLIESSGEFEELIEFPIAVSFNKETLEKLQTNLENRASKISKDEWEDLASKFSDYQDKMQDEDIWDTPTSEGIYEYVSKKYTMEELEDAEDLYEFNYPKKYYTIGETDYYE